MDFAHPNQIGNQAAVSNSGAKTSVNLLALFTIIAGSLFKTMYWAGADILILVSTVALLISVFFMYRDMQQSGTDSTTTFLVSGLLFLLVLSALFRRMHWEGGQILVMAAIAASIIAAVYLIFRRGDIRFPKQFAVAFLLYIMYIMGAISGLLGRMQAMADGNL